jgi:hypothetical protein
MSGTEDHAETLRQLREATREAHEALQGARDERRRLEVLKAEIRRLVTEATQETIGMEIEKGSKIVMLYQKALEEEIKERFDTLINGPLQDMEKLLRNLHKVYSTVPLSRITMNPLPENPLFQKRE